MRPLSVKRRGRPLTPPIRIRQTHALGADDNGFGTDVEGGVTAFKQSLEREWLDSNGLFQSIAYRLLREPSAAEDACQQAFLHAMEKGDGLRDQSRLRPWLCRIVTNCALEMIRERKRQGVSGIPAEAGTVDAPQDLVRLSLLEALSSLEEETRVVVVMRIMEEMPGHHVARVLDISQAEVSRRLHFGMDSLRHHLRDLA